MNCAPVVSVIMPVYNAERYLRAAIDSILAQSFHRFELLIIDDGSTDGSMEIVRSYTDSRIRVFSEPHRGLVAALNKGLTEARGDYIARMDADDVSKPERLCKQVAYMQSHPETPLVGCWARLIDAKGKPTGNSKMPPTQGWRLRVALCGANQFVHGSVMMRREAVLQVGGYRAAFVTTEDYDLWLRLGEVGVLANLAEPLYELRVHQSSKTACEGDMVETCAQCARRAALQRCLSGRDHLGYARLPSLRAPGATSRGRLPAEGAVTIADWAEAHLWRRQLLLGNYLLLRALLSHPGDYRPWDVVRRCYMSRDTIRVLLSPARRVWRQIAAAI